MGDMDSANSGSLQSSSGGDDDYESTRVGVAPDSFYSLFNHQSNYPPAAHVTSFNPSPPTLPPAFFDPLASYLDHLSRSTNPDPVWPKDTLPTPEQLSIPSSSGPAGFENPQPSSSAAGNSQPGQTSGGRGGVRNPKKRTRASRRAPTTVLTTDTTNFRAMVQEFTGIPAPPFGGGGGNSSSSAFYPRTRLDLFGGRMDAPTPSTNLPPYLLRPLAQKIPIPIPNPRPPPLVSNLTATNKNGSDVMTASSSGGGNFQIPDLGLFTTDVPTNLSFGSSLKYPSDSTDPGSSKPGFGGSLELPVTTTARNDEVHDQLGGITASFFPTTDGAVNSSSGKNNGGGPLGWAEGLGLGADAASAGAPAPSTTPGLPNSRHSDYRQHNLGFAQQ